MRIDYNVKTSVERYKLGVGEVEKCNRLSGVFPHIQIASTQLPVLIPLINAFIFEGKEREHCGPQRSKKKMKALGKA